MTRQIQSPGIVRTLCKHFQGYLVIFKDTDAYSSTLTGMHLRAEKSPDSVHLWVKLFIQNVVL